MSGRLSGKVCVITGTGGSMGRASALAFAREGASVVGCDVTVESAESTVEMVRSAGGEMVSRQPCHLDDPADCEALVELALGTLRQGRRAVQPRRDVVLQLARGHHGRGVG